MGLVHPDVIDPNKKRPHWGNSFGPLSEVPQYPANPEESIPGHQGWICFNKPFKYNSETDRDKMPDELNAEYAQKILQAEHDKPFLLAIGFNRPHTPFHAPKEFFDKFPLSEVEMPTVLENDLEDCAKALWNPNKTWTNAGFSKFKFLAQHSKPNMWKKWVQAYLANVAFVDAQVGKVLDAIKNSKYAENTIVILTSDHGYHLGEKEYTFKASLWEEASRIPLVISAPGISKKSTRVSHPVSLIDIYPTLIDLCELPQNPNENTNQMPLGGFSLKSFLKNPENANWEGPDFALISIAAKDKLEVNQAADPRKQFYALRTENYRYILCPNGEEELYDHKADPYEWRNLAGDSKHLKLKTQFKNQLFKYISKH